jgi:uncharacterized protein (TIGR02145 family)
MDINASYNSSSWNGSDVKHQGICPSGWHIPSDAEWDALMTAVGGSTSTVGTKLKATSGWSSYGYDGTDDFGFSALPGGSGNSDGDFGSAGDRGFWWSSTEDNTDKAYRRYMYYANREVTRLGNGKTYLHSVRCLQDSAP